MNLPVRKRGSDHTHTLFKCKWRVMLEEQGVPQKCLPDMKPRSTYFRNALLLRHMMLTAGIYQVSGKNKMNHPLLQPYAKKKFHQIRSSLSGKSVQSPKAHRYPRKTAAFHAALASHQHQLLTKCKKGDMTAALLSNTCNNPARHRQQRRNDSQALLTRTHYHDRTNKCI